MKERAWRLGSRRMRWNPSLLARIRGMPRRLRGLVVESKLSHFNCDPFWKSTRIASSASGLAGTLMSHIDRNSALIERERKPRTLLPNFLERLFDPGHPLGKFLALHFGLHQTADAEHHVMRVSVANRGAEAHRVLRGIHGPLDHAEREAVALSDSVRERHRFALELRARHYQVDEAEARGLVGVDEAALKENFLGLARRHVPRN